MKEKGFWEGAQAAMPTALGYVSIGLACGIIGAPYVTPVEMGLMSLFVYAGSAQFAMLALIAVQAPVAAIAMTVFLINLRLFLLSLHASTYFRHTSLWQNIGMSSLLTDETYGVLMGELAHADKVNPMWMHGNNLNSYVAWFVGTVVGTALGGLLPNPEIFALILSSVVTGKVGSLPQIKWLDFLAVFPTAWVAFRYRNLVGTVLFGVVLIAVLRLVF
ncbi:AzlC family protein [Streptococcus pneumoniae]|nr:AzlC family protein [Streptococcus pneumoniae]CAG5902970.1 AzlC family protein [Streptococcus pneumoniae]CAG5906362.1 AzlC family protein [Streptococcus pneumoniae]